MRLINGNYRRCPSWDRQAAARRHLRVFCAKNISAQLAASIYLSRWGAWNTIDVPVFIAMTPDAQEA
jgi:hypothetical protein